MIVAKISNTAAKALHMMPPVVFTGTSVDFGQIMS
jgi:hypothetical protein